MIIVKILQLNIYPFFKITTFKNFFVSMILPPSLVRGEILHLQVVVYNYFDHDLKNVLVVLSKTDDFKVNKTLSNISNCKNF